MVSFNLEDKSTRLMKVLLQMNKV